MPQWWCLWEYEGPRESNAFWQTLKISFSAPLGFPRPLALLHVQKFYALLKVSLWHGWAYKLHSERQKHTWLNPHVAPWRKMLLCSSFWSLPLPPLKCKFDESIVCCWLLTLTCVVHVVCDCADDTNVKMRLRVAWRPRVANVGMFYISTFFFP